MTPGEKLRECRGTTSRKEVAESVKISVSALQMYECDTRVPRDVVKQRLADYYNKTVQEIFFT